MIEINRSLHPPHKEIDAGQEFSRSVTPTAAKTTVEVASETITTGAASRMATRRGVAVLRALGMDYRRIAAALDIEEHDVPRGLISLTLRLPPTAKLDPGSRSSFVNPAFLRVMRYNRKVSNHSSFVAPAMP
jgi:hypothetical protein